MSTIKIIKGSYLNQPVLNEVFTLVKGYQLGAKGGFVTVKNDGQFSVQRPKIRVRVDNISDIEFLTGPVETTQQAAPISNDKPKETDEEAMNRIGKRFQILDTMSKAAINGDIRAMIVSGPPGVGKSAGVEEQMEKASLFDKVKGDRARFQIIKGAMSGIGLFALLYKYSDKKNVLVFDDCDIWEDQDALNVLKGALDSGKQRRISWNKDSRILRDEGVPNTFNFNGSIIFITNLDFSDRRSKKIQAHLDALQSRCHYIDLTINTERDKMLRIKQVHRDADQVGGLFARYGFDDQTCNEILAFMWDNHTQLREVSLRMAIKIADLVKVDSANWKDLARATCMRAV